MARDNNEMLKRLCKHLDKIESADYQLSEDLKQMAINMIADIAVDNNQRQQRLDGNNQNLFR